MIKWFKSRGFTDKLYFLNLAFARGGYYILYGNNSSAEYAVYYRLLNCNLRITRGMGRVIGSYRFYYLEK